MKIAMLYQAYPPMVSGAALFVEKLAINMSDRGHEVLVIVASERPEPYRITSSNLIVERCSSVRNPFRVGHRFAVWPHRLIVERLNEFSPDVIHLHDPFQFALSGLFFGHRKGLPAVFTIHQLPWFVSAYLPNFLNIRQIFEKGLWRYACWLLRQFTVSVVSTQTIAELVYVHTNVLPEVISSGVDLDTFQPICPNPDQKDSIRTRLGVPGRVPIILHVGRLDVDKRVERVLLAAAQAMQHTQAHLVVVGDGTQRTKLIELCSQLGISTSCHFPGYISIENGLPDIYRAASLFVTASPIETQGMVLLEAAASGLPIAAVQATCVHEIVHSGENGLLAPPGDIEGLARIIAWLLQNPAQAQKMGQAGRVIVQDHAIGKTLEAYETLYQRASILSLN